MNNNTHFELITVLGNGESVDIVALDSASGETYYHVYNTLTVQGAASAVVNITLNGNTMDLAGGTVFRYPIRTLTVNSGAGVILSGYRQAKEIFGN